MEFLSDAEQCGSALPALHTLHPVDHVDGPDRQPVTIGSEAHVLRLLFMKLIDR